MFSIGWPGLAQLLFMLTKFAVSLRMNLAVYLLTIIALIAALLAYLIQPRAIYLPSAPKAQEKIQPAPIPAKPEKKGTLPAPAGTV